MDQEDREQARQHLTKARDLLMMGARELDRAADVLGTSIEARNARAQSTQARLLMLSVLGELVADW